MCTVGLSAVQSDCQLVLWLCVHTLVHLLYKTDCTGLDKNVLPGQAQHGNPLCNEQSVMAQ